MRRFKIFDNGLTEDVFKYEVWKTYYMTEEAIKIIFRKRISIIH